MVENRLERILEDKAYVFTSCFAPMNCSAFGPVDDYECDPISTQDDVQARKNDALLKMGVDVKKHVAKFVAPRDTSLMRDDDDDDDDDHQALLTELEAQVHELNLTGNHHESSRDGPSTSIEFELADSGSISELNTIGEHTWDDLENHNGTGEPMISGRVLGNNINATNNQNQVALHHLLNGKHLTGMYKQSIRSKFEFYRKHQSFVPSPRTSGNENTTDCDATQTKFFAFLKVEPNDSDLMPIITTPQQSRRNELARKILLRRQAESKSMLLDT